MENVGEPDWISAALHGPGYSGNTPLVQRAPFAGGGDATAWHIYVVEWLRDGFVFKVDDQTIYRVTRAMVEQHGRWAFDNPKFVILNLALGGNYPFAVNNAKTPYKGITDATVQAIKDGAGVVLIDWVRITGTK
jgi:beta-glucanase (GH16 family)